MFVYLGALFVAEVNSQSVSACVLAMCITLWGQCKFRDRGISCPGILLFPYKKFCLSGVSWRERLSLLEVFNGALRHDKRNYGCPVLRGPCLCLQTNSHFEGLALTVRNRHCFLSTGPEQRSWAVHHRWHGIRWEAGVGEVREIERGREEACIAGRAARHGGPMVSVMSVLRLSWDQSLCLPHRSSCCHWADWAGRNLEQLLLFWHDTDAGVRLSSEWYLITP